MNIEIHDFLFNFSYLRPDELNLCYYLNNTVKGSGNTRLFKEGFIFT